MPNQPKPNWQPISALSLIASIIDGALKDTEEQYQTLLEAKDKPWVLDDALVARVIKVYKDQLDDLGLYEEQLSRWEKTKLTTQQQQEVTRLKKQLGRNKQVTQSILAMADELKENTIDQILARDDAQLAIDVLTGKLKPPRNF